MISLSILHMKFKDSVQIQMACLSKIFHPIQLHLKIILADPTLRLIKYIYHLIIQRDN
jgi:hypothetical protein